MAKRCIYCADLYVSDLVKLAKIELADNEWWSFPEEAFYRHHSSWENLEVSAKSGCDLCQFIIRCVKETPITDHVLSPYPSYYYAVTSQSPSNTDVRICISSTNSIGFANDNDLPFQPRAERVFDTLVIRFGDHAVGVDQPSVRKEPVPPLHLALVIPREKPIYADGYRIGRYQLDANLGSETNYSIARNWLTECCETHELCQSSKVLQALPTRVIDVGISSSCRLFCPRGARGSYAALSHCWGGPIDPVLTMKTVGVFQEELPYSSLPANFRDAISITRQLGIRFLWIDSLCILQDSVEDWKCESKKMASIYSNSLVTISALTSPKSTAGILSTSITLPKSGPDLRVFHDAASISVQLRRRPTYTENLRSLFAHSPLSQRGWALQESILPPRQLYYGRQQIYWKCFSPPIYSAPSDLSGKSTRTETGNGLSTSNDDLSQANDDLFSLDDVRDLPAWSPTDFDNMTPIGSAYFRSADGLFSPGYYFPDGATYPALSSLLHNPSHQLGIHFLLLDFRFLVEDYSRRDLTVHTDRLPAIAGLVQRAQEFLSSCNHDCNYIAGVWVADIPSALLWLRWSGWNGEWLLDNMKRRRLFSDINRARIKPWKWPGRVWTAAIRYWRSYTERSEGKQAETATGSTQSVNQSGRKNGKHALPSWSWATIDAPVKFQPDLSYDSMQFLYPPNHWNLELLSHHVVSQDCGAWLRVRGLTVRLRIDIAPLYGGISRQNNLGQGGYLWLDEVDSWGGSAHVLWVGASVQGEGEEDKNEAHLRSIVELSKIGRKDRKRFAEVAGEYVVLSGLRIQDSQEHYCLVVKRAIGERDEQYRRAGLMSIKQNHPEGEKIWRLREMVLI